MATKKTVRKPRAKKVVEPVVEAVAEPVVDTTVSDLEARQSELLGLLDTMQTNGFKDVGNIEVTLSVVNRDLEYARSNAS